MVNPAAEVGKYDAPSVINPVRLKKTQRGEQNVKQIADEIKNRSAIVAKEVAKPGDSSAEIFTLIIGKPLVGYYTAEIEMRVIWLARKVPGVPSDNKQKFATFNVTYGFNGQQQKKAHIADTMLIDVKSNKPIDNEHKEVAANIEDSFMDWVESLWPETDRKKKYRKPSVYNMIDGSPAGSNSSIILNQSANYIQAIIKQLTEVGDSAKDRFNLVVGNEETGFFRAEISIEALFSNEDDIIITIYCVIYFGGEVIQDMQDVGSFDAGSRDASVWRSDLEPIAQEIDDEFNDQIADTLNNIQSAKFFIRNPYKSLPYTYYKHLF